AHAAVAEPAALGPDIDVLGDSELAARAADESSVALHAGRDRPWIGEVPAGGGHLRRDCGRGRQHRHGEPLAAVLRHVEEAQEIDMLRPDIGLAAKTDVLALVLPGGDGREAG